MKLKHKILGILLTLGVLLTSMLVYSLSPCGGPGCG